MPREGVARIEIEEGFFPQKARKGPTVLTSRTPFGMTGVIFVAAARVEFMVLLVAEGDYGVDFGGSAGWEVAGQDGGGE